MIEHITKRKRAFTLVEGGRSPRLNLSQCKNAFTLAEVLITLSVIGIVAALTIPSMIENHNNKAWSTAKDLWNKKLVEVTRQMNIDGVMTGVANSTEDYMNYFKKYVKVIKTCDNSKLKNCYSSTVIRTAGDEVAVENLRTSKNFGHKDWETNTQGVVFADGTTGILAYDKECKAVDPLSSEGQVGQISCLSLLIDVNGKKGPNKIGYDVMSINASITGCDLKLPTTKLCMAASDVRAYSYESINTCDGSEDLKWDTRGSNNSSCAFNYWAAARKICAELDMRLPSAQELADIATYIYHQEDNPIGAYENRTGIDMDDDVRGASLGWSKTVQTATYWTGESFDDRYAYSRYFEGSRSLGGRLRYSYDLLSNRRVSYSHQFRCVSN